MFVCFEKVTEVVEGFGFRQKSNIKDRNWELTCVQGTLREIWEKKKNIIYFKREVWVLRRVQYKINRRKKRSSQEKER